MGAVAVPMAMMRGEKPRDFKGTMIKLIKYLGSYRVAILVVMLFAIASTVFSILGPKILGNATTKLFEGVMAQIAGTGSIDFDYIGTHHSGGDWALYLLSAILSYIQGWVMTDVAMNITYRFRKDISAEDQPHAASGISTARTMARCSRASPTMWIRSARPSTRA